MKILIANLGSTSFKYRLFDMDGPRQLARGAIDRIGEDESLCVVEIGDRREEQALRVPDYATAVQQCFTQLTDPQNDCLGDVSEIAAIGLKAVHGGRLSGVQRVTPDLIAAMEEMNVVAPAHNPPYIAAMRQLQERLPDMPLVAVFETGFHATIPERNRCYAVPYEWGETCLVKRWGFHGASHRYIAQRMNALLCRDDSSKKEWRIISCHLGGSSSLCAIRNGQSVATSMGLSPQSGLPQTNRVGDFDPFALPLVMQQTGKTLDEVLASLSRESGLLGVGGIGGDIRDILQAASEGNERAKLALDIFVSETRRYLGGMLVELGGADAIVFTAGIGEHRATIRSEICRDLSELGIVLDEEANQAVEGEARIDAASSRVEIWVVPTNEEIIVAREVQQFLQR